MPGQTLAPACYDPSPAREVSVEGRFNPWQNEGLIVAQEHSDGPSVIELPSSVPEARTGYRMFVMDPLSSATWMQLDMRVVGTLLFESTDPVPTVDQINGSPIKATPLKARIEWMEAGGQHQNIIIGVGAGTSFAVPPTNQVWVDAIVPDPATDTPERVPVPDDFDRNRFRFATTVATKITCVASPSARGPRLSQYLFIPGSLGPDTVAGQLIQIPRYAGRLEIFSSVAFGNSVAPVIGDITAEFVQNYTVSGPFAVPPFPSIPTQTIPFVDPFRTAVTPIPPQFNAVRIRPAPAMPGIRRNVTIVYTFDL